MADEFQRFRYHVKPPTGPVNVLVQPGELAFFPSAAIPSGWVKADGSYYAPEDKPGLFHAIGYRHGRDAQNRFRVPVITDIIEHVNPSKGDQPFVVGVDGVRPHDHNGGQLSSSGGHAHSVTVLNWFDLPYPIHYIFLSPAPTAYGGDVGISYNTVPDHVHGVVASGGGGVETVPKHVILTCCVCALGDDLDLLT